MFDAPALPRHLRNVSAWAHRSSRGPECGGAGHDNGWPDLGQGGHRDNQHDSGCDQKFRQTDHGRTPDGHDPTTRPDRFGFLAGSLYSKQRLLWQSRGPKRCCRCSSSSLSSSDMRRITVATGIVSMDVGDAWNRERTFDGCLQVRPRRDVGVQHHALSVEGAERDVGANGQRDRGLIDHRPGLDGGLSAKDRVTGAIRLVRGMTGQ